MKNKNRFALLCCVLAAVVVSVDVSPQALNMLLKRGNDAWISNVYYTWPTGIDMALVESGKPSDVSKFDLVEAGELRVYVPQNKNFEGDIPKIVDFPRATGHIDVGASNVK